jgi:peptide/nickel transport system substrate-binding protein
VAALASALALASCGGGGGSTKGGFGNGAPVKGKKGGTLTVLSSGDVDYIDPGAAYYQFSYIFMYATQRPLFSYKPDDDQHAVPDLAAGPATISDGGRTVTVKIKPGVRFSPPVNRAVTSKDVKYAIERGFNPTVANGYAMAYFGTIMGAKTAKGGPIAGIQTPDAQTIVFRLTKPEASTIVGALSLPLSAAVPPEYARKLDQANPSQYGTHQVATGPYMVQNDRSGKATGYQPGKRIAFVRNPNWDPKTDYRPAYVDQIVLSEGNSDPVASARRILTGRSLVNGQADFNVPPPIIKQIAQGSAAQKKQFVAGTSTGRVRYVSLNTTIKPFDNVDVRKAIVAATDRNALRQKLGGPLAGDIPTHFLPPDIPGFAEAGGAAGPGNDFLKSPTGDLQLAQSYMRKAGYPSGKYTGGQAFLMVADNSGPTRDAAQVMQAQLAKLGFQVTPRFVTHDSMYTKFCNVPKQKVPICPSTGWQKDFPDPESMLSPTFNGENIVPVNNSNWPQLNVKPINATMDRDAPIVDPAQRAKAWADVDKLVTAQAPGVPWLWDKGMGIESPNVQGVLNKFNAAWDLSFTSLK